MSKYKPRRYSGTFGGNPTVQEDRIASRLSGKRVRGSGASKYSKGDVRGVSVGDIEFLVECKQTEKASISVTWKWLSKISNEAVGQQAEPALSIEMKGGEDDPGVDRDWIMVPVRVFEQIKSAALKEDK